ncbi:MAG: ABC transporter substrate-binding protein [Chloroflexi bacterium]|nr:ABC transporter substrate-binding protein [Chloroflexota bacterium]
MASDYWNKYWQSRSSRRRFLVGAGTVGVGAASIGLVGCGDDDDGGGDGGGLATPTTGAAATATPVDPFAGAKRGGTYKLDVAGDPPTIDPYGNLSFLTKGAAAHVYSRLFKYNAGPGVKLADLKPVPDAALSATPSADGLTWTVKLNPAVKFHNVAPVNGRAMTTEDVDYSWKRATDAKNTNASQLAFVESVTYPDASTIVFKLKAPNAAFLDVLADSNLLWIMPKEAGISGSGGFDPAKVMIGSGPWKFDSYTPSVSIKYKRNENWHFKSSDGQSFPLMDGIEYAVIPEYANRLAQFLSKNTDHTGLVADDLVNVKKQIPDVQLYGEVSQLLSFMFFDSDPASPLQKAEVRQAISMSMDRDALTDLGYNVKKLRDAGLTVRDDWNNLIPAGMNRFWLDPKGTGQGDTAKFFKYNVAEAKKLMTAAGYADGFTVPYQYTGNRYGATFNTLAEAHIQFLQAIGIKVNTEVQDYSSKYITQTFTGNFKGIAFGYETPFPEGGSYPIRFFTDNPLNHGKVKDAALADLATKQQAELDPEKRKQMFYDIQRKNAEKMYYVPLQAGAGTGWEGAHGYLKNLDIQTVPGSYGGPTEEAPFRWKAT